MKNTEIIGSKGQLTLPEMHSEVQKMSPDGIEMGVLENGMPYLSQRGLVKMAGIARTTFQTLTNNWQSEKMAGAGLAINKLLLDSGYDEDELYIEINSDGKTIYAYTEPVCLAILEYHAFDAKKKSVTAQNSFRVLSKAGFRVFVYQYTGYRPQHDGLDSWKHFHDRVDLTYDAVPSGYYCIFREIAGMIVTLIRSNVLVNDKMIPDISVGISWGKNWTSSKMGEKYGDRIKYEHNYPDYYPQSLSNPQPANAYPNESLHVFRQWFEDTYLKTKFPTYMLNSMKKGKVTKESATLALEAISKTKKLTDFDKTLKKALDYNPKDS